MGLDEVTLREAITWVGGAIGTGGITAILVAWLGTKRPRDEAPTTPVVTGIGALLADRSSIDALADEMRDVAHQMSRLADGIFRFIERQEQLDAQARAQARHFRRHPKNSGR